MKVIKYYLYSDNKHYICFLLIFINLINLAGCNKNFSYRKYHTVKKKETLYFISKKYNIKLKHLAERNRLKYPYTLRAGQKLIIANSFNRANYNQRKINSKIIYNNVNNNNIDNTKINKNKVNHFHRNLDVPNKKNSHVSNNSNSSHKIIANGANNFTVKSSTSKANATKFNSVKPNQSITADAITNSNILKENVIKKMDWGDPANGKIIKLFTLSGPSKSNGIGIAGNKGDPVFSAANGRVVYCGNNLRGYGNLVIIKHNEDFLSAYAHNDKILVKEQQLVTKGQKIALMGDTDASRVLLHFEIRYKGRPIDPLKILKTTK